MDDIPEISTLRGFFLLLLAGVVAGVVIALINGSIVPTLESSLIGKQTTG